MDVVHAIRTFNIESVQRRTARFVTNEYSTTPGTVTKILNDLKWLTLEKRRKVARFTTMFQVVSGLSATQFPPYILFKRRQGTRQFHLKKFIQVGAKTNKYTVKWKELNRPQKPDRPQFLEGRFGPCWAVLDNKS